jgi:hypothetical protein
LIAVVAGAIALAVVLLELVLWARARRAPFTPVEEPLLAQRNTVEEREPACIR